MSNKILLELAARFEKLANQPLDWDNIARAYSNKLLPAFRALDDAADFLEELGKKLPKHAHHACHMRQQRLFKFNSELSQLQDDIMYGIKPAAEAPAPEPEPLVEYQDDEF